MAIDQAKYGQLQALSTGGTQGMNDYLAQQAQGQSARQNAIGGMLSSLPAESQAGATSQFNQYAPQVDTSAGIGSPTLLAAKNQYLSAGANKLAESAYEAQQKLALQREQMNAPTEADRAAQMQGAIAQYQDNQLGQERNQAQQGIDQFDQALKGKDQLYGIEKGRGDLLATLPPEQQKAIADARTNLTNAQALGDPLLLRLATQQFQDAQAPLAQYDENARNQLAGVQGSTPDQMAALNQYLQTGDTKGWYDTLHTLGAQADAKGQNLTDPNSIQAQPISQDDYSRLAGAFGVDPLAARGKYSDQLGQFAQDQSRQQAIANMMNGGSTAEKVKANKDEQNAEDQVIADQLGFDDPTQLRSLRNSTKMGAQEISDVLQTPQWADLDNLYGDFATGNRDALKYGENGDSNYFDGGYAGFTQAVRDKLNGLDIADGDKRKLVELATAYYGPRLKAQLGSDKSAVG